MTLDWARNSFKIWMGALHICGMILLVLWDGHLAPSLVFQGSRPILQESSLDSATPGWDLDPNPLDLSIR